MVDDLGQAEPRDRVRRLPKLFDVALLAWPFGGGDGIAPVAEVLGERVPAPRREPGAVKEFTYGFVNTFTPEEAKAAYEKYYVPETGQIFYEAGFANFHLHPPTELDFKYEERAPLLIIGADQDHTVPASVAKKQFKKYEKSPAQTDYLEFAGRPHLMMTAEKWAEIAGAIEGWIASVPEKTGVAVGKASA